MRESYGGPFLRVKRSSAVFFRFRINKLLNVNSNWGRFGTKCAIYVTSLLWHKTLLISDITHSNLKLYRLQYETTRIRTVDCKLTQMSHAITCLPEYIENKSLWFTMGPLSFISVLLSWTLAACFWKIVPTWFLLNDISGSYFTVSVLDWHLLLKKWYCFLVECSIVQLKWLEWWCCYLCKPYLNSTMNQPRRNGMFAVNR